MVDGEIILHELKGTQIMLFDNNKRTINSDNKLMQKNIKLMFVETFIVNLCILVIDLYGNETECVCMPSRMNVQYYIRWSEKFFSV